MLEATRDIIEARMSFFDAQDAMNRVSEYALDAVQPVSWYGSTVSDERGSFAMVSADNEANGLPNLVGEHLRLTVGDRSVNVYVIGTSPDVLTPIAVTRRVFMELALLAEANVTCVVEVLL